MATMGRMLQRGSVTAAPFDFSCELWVRSTIDSQDLRMFLYLSLSIIPRITPGLVPPHRPTY